MAGMASEESGVGRSAEGISIGQHCQSGEALAEWRSSEQVENGTPSTSPLYWDTDDDDDSWTKPSELYGKYTWKIEKFSQINKRELRSNAFEVGGYKWYILIYPQGCDVCNHLSLFLSVANHDKLLPGWSHFAQFTIAVMNKDPKKSKYSDTLHRFWKKEHDWGWKKFMELSKVSDGFKDGDTLIIKAQVQVIRERTDRPFRCLDCQYRRELVRVYLTNVEQICRRFVEERRGKLGRLIEDEARRSSFCAFWLGIDQNARHCMCREKMDAILKVVVKHFFIEKEVTSTLVMDSLYSGLKALEGQSKSKKARAKLLDIDDTPAPIVHIEDDMFVLVDDVLLLLERAALEPLPPKDEKGPQNRSKDGNSGEDCNKDSIERDERRLTELGRRTVEIFVLAHIFCNKIEVAYQEAVALKRQEELIREEEALWLAECEQKAKRGAAEKERKSKKKQVKKKRNNRKGKEKKREERSSVALSDRLDDENPSDEKKEAIVEDDQAVPEKPDMLGDGSDVSDSVDGVAEVLQPDSEDRDTSPVNWDTDASEVIPPTEASSSGVCSLSSAPNGTIDKRSPSVMDDSSSTCSTDSVPSLVMNGPYKGNSLTNYQNQKLPSRENQRGKARYDVCVWATETDNRPSRPVTNAGEHNDVSEICKAGESESEAVSSLKDEAKLLEHSGVKEEVSTPQKKLSMKEPVDTERPKEKTTAVPSSPRSSLRNLHTPAQLKSAADPVPHMKASSNGQQQTDQVAVLCTLSPVAGVCKSEIRKAAASKQTEKPMEQQVPHMSRPSSAPLVPGPRPTAPVVSLVHTTPLLARSVSAAGRLGPDLSPATHSYVPQSYRNVKMGSPVGSCSSGLTYPNSSSLGVNPSPAYSQQQALVSAPMFLPPSSERIDPNSVHSAFSFSMVTRDVIQSGDQWTESSQRGPSRILQYDPSSMANDIQNHDLYKPITSGSQEHFSNEFPACTSGRQTQGVLADEFPHLDIINDLLDDEHSFGMAAGASTVLQSLSGGRTQSYHDEGFQRGHSSSGGHFDSAREFIPQATALPYSNGQIDGMVPTMWPIAGSDMSLLGMRNTEGEGYPYFHPEYSNLTCAVNGYAVFQPSNGH